MSDAQTFNTGLRRRRMSPAREEDQGLNVTGFIWLEDIVEKLWRKHRVRSIAAQRGISAETLLNLWVQEKAAEETSGKRAT